MSRTSSIRCAGLAGAVLLAVSGVLGGALPGADVASTPLSVARGPAGPVVLACWLAGTLLLAGAWWAGRSGVPSVRWVAVTAVLWLAPFLAVPPLGSRDVYSYACQGWMFTQGIDPYRVGVAAAGCPWVESVTPIWRDTPAPYGPTFLLVAAGVVALGATPVPILLLFRVVALAGLVAVAVTLPVLARRCGVPPRAALWTALAGPLVGVHLIGGPHSEAVLLGLVVPGLALAAARPGHRGALLGAGALLGLAVLVKSPAVVVLPFAVGAAAAGIRSGRGGGATGDATTGDATTGDGATGDATTGDATTGGGSGGAATGGGSGPGGRAVWVPVLRAAGWLGGGAAAAAGGVTAAAGLGAGWLGALRQTGDLVQFTSVPTAVGMTLTYLGRLVDGRFDAVPATRAVALVALAVVLVVLVVRRVLRPGATVRDALHGAGLALAATVLLAPLFHPWYATWPLVLLAATTTRTTLVSAVSAASAFLVLPDGGGLARFAKFPGAPVVTLVTAVLAVRAWRARAAAGGAGAVQPAGANRAERTRSSQDSTAARSGASGSTVRVPSKRRR